MEVEFGKVVAVLGDQIALVDLPHVGEATLDRDPERPKLLLVSFEHPLEGRVVLLLITGNGVPDLLDRKRTSRVQQERDEVDETFDLLHGAYGTPACDA